MTLGKLPNVYITYCYQDLDMVLISNGTLLMIQNMTWNGAQGFTQKPSGEHFPVQFSFLYADEN